jgi:hypothetical protein
MVYIVSHTWPDRWTGPGRKNGLIVYSNCDEVELFNDVRDRSLGVRRRGPVGTHFQWDDVEVNTNVLYAEGRVGGKVVATDAIVLKNLPDAPHRRELNGKVANLTAAAPGQNYLYRVNCGGPDFVDGNGQRWLADRDFVAGNAWGSLSWARDYAELPVRFGSQREFAGAVAGTNDEALFQTYRYGREKLRYRFAVPAGDYRLELYLVEPWYGAGGGDCTGWRLFDVAVNGTTLLRDVDLWKEAGYGRAVKKVVSARVRDGWLEISFPRVASYQAVISAIAISTSDPTAKVPELIGAEVSKVGAGVPAGASASPRTVAPSDDVTTYPAAVAKLDGSTLTWAIQLGLGGSHDYQLRYTNHSPAAVPVVLSVYASDGSLVGQQMLALAPTARGTSGLSPVASLSMNAGDFTVTLAKPSDSLKIDSLLVR